MKVNGIQRSAIALAIYVLAFAGLVFLQFSRAQRKDESLGALKISVIERSARSADDKGFPDELRLAFNGMTFLFGKGNPLAVKDLDGGHQALLPLSWRKTSSSVQVFFERRLSLEFRSPEDGSTFSVSAESPETEIVTLILPYGLSGASLEERKGEGITLRSRAAAYALSIGGGTRLDAEGHSLLIQNGDGVFRLALRESAPKPKATAAAPSLAKIAPMDQKEYASLVEAWLDKAWLGLSRDRLAAGDAGWTLGGSVEFSEAALTAYAAEARERGAWPTHSARIASLAKANASRLGWRSAPFLGNLQRNSGALLAEDQAASARIKALTEARDASVFITEGLAAFLVDRAPSDVSREVFDFAATLDQAILSPEAACGYLACMAEAEKFFPGSSNPFQSGQQLIEKTLPRLILTLTEGIFLSLDGKTAGLGNQIRLGLALESWGSSQGSARALALGQRLVASALSLSDASGVLPSTLAIAGKALGARSGLLAPEDLFHLASDNPWYPRQVSLRKEVGPGCWAWISSPSLTVEASASRVLLSVKHETGSAHYLSFYGIRPFNQIKLYDIPYRAATDFEIYNASGYLYQRSSSVLWVKLKHNKEVEVIELDY